MSESPNPNVSFQKQFHIDPANRTLTVRIDARNMSKSILKGQIEGIKEYLRAYAAIGVPPEVHTYEGSQEGLVDLIFSVEKEKLNLLQKVLDEQGSAVITKRSSPAGTNGKLY